MIIDQEFDSILYIYNVINSFFFLSQNIYWTECGLYCAALQYASKQQRNADILRRAS